MAYDIGSHLATSRNFALPSSIIGKGNTGAKVAAGAGKAAKATGKGLSALAHGLGQGLGKLAKGISSTTSSATKHVGHGHGSSSKSSSSSFFSSKPKGSSSSQSKGFTHWLPNKLAQHSRKSQLKSYARIERKSAQGNPVYRAYVNKQVILAKKGNKTANTHVQAMKLARITRLASRTPPDRLYLHHGNKLAVGVLKKNPQALKQYKQLQAAAAKGDPRAKKLLAGAGISAAVITTVATGRIVLPKSSSAQLKATRTKQVSDLRQKALAGKITRKEALDGAKLAKQIGDKDAESYLTQVALVAPVAATTVPLAKSKETKPEQAKPDEASQAPKKTQDKDLARQEPETSSESSPQNYAESERAPEQVEEASTARYEASSLEEIQKLYTKLWTEHAVQLAEQDKNANLPAKSLENYETLSKLWAKQELAKQGIPTVNLAGHANLDQINLTHLLQGCT
jgi:hypothetical protein